MKMDAPDFQISKYTMEPALAIKPAHWWPYPTQPTGDPTQWLYEL